MDVWFGKILDVSLPAETERKVGFSVLGRKGAHSDGSWNLPGDGAKSFAWGP